MLDGSCVWLEHMNGGETQSTKDEERGTVANELSDQTPLKGKPTA
jgi:hypothetical protein